MNSIDRLSEPYRASIEAHYNGWIASNFGSNEPLAEFVITFCLSVVLYWAMGLAFFVIDLTKRPSWIYRFKIQKSSQIGSLSVSKMMAQIVRNQMLQVVVTVSLLQLKYGYDLVQRRVPSLQRFLLEFILFNLVREVTFYYSHRVLHHSSIYKYVHKRHHEWQTPIALAAAYCHPLEHVIANMLPVLAGPFLLHSHNLSAYFFMAFVVWETLLVHSGYQLPFIPISPVFHDYHHFKFTGNYGVFGFLDRLHNTDQQFRKSKYVAINRLYFSFTPPPELRYNGDKMK